MNKTLVALAISVATFSGVANANFVGSQSDNTNVEVGESTVNGGPHVAGRAGIGVASMGLTKKVDFQALTAYGSQSNGIHTITGGHGGLGTFNFAKVGAGDVWFGEWSDGTSSNSNRAVYYVGDSSNTTLPASGTATYAVKGVNQYNGSNHLTGSFTANFNTNILSGNIANSNLKVGVNAVINATTASFAGQAKANDSTIGFTQGHFFGADAAALAGFAKFTDSNLNTAFGGTKQ